MPDCLFCSIAAGDIPAAIVVSDDDVVAFRDIDPKAPVHILVAPRRHFANAGELAQADPELAGRVLATAATVARAEGLSDFRIVMNTGAGAGQSVFHVHAHVLGGRDLTWPPG